MRPKAYREDSFPTGESCNFKCSVFNGVDAVNSKKFTQGYCSYCYNIKFKNGIMTNAQGVKLPSVTLEDGTVHSLSISLQNVNIKKIVLFPRFDTTNNVQDDYLVALGSNGHIYVAPTSSCEFTELPLVSFTSTDVSFVCYYFDGYDVILMASATSGEFYLYDVRNVRTMSQAPGMSSICIYNDRVYCTGTNFWTKKIKLS